MQSPGTKFIAHLKPCFFLERTVHWILVSPLPLGVGASSVTFGLLGGRIHRGLLLFHCLSWVWPDRRRGVPIVDTKEVGADLPDDCANLWRAGLELGGTN